MKNTIMSAQVSAKSAQKVELSFDWKQISKQYKKDPAGLDSFIKESKNKIALMLIEATKKRKIVPDLLRKTNSQSCFNQIIFNEDEIWGEVYLVISHMLQRWESYCRDAVLNNKKMTHASQEGELRMHTESDLIGYFRNSLQHAFADLYVKHNAQKRAANEVTFSSMQYDSGEENDRQFEDTLACNRSGDIIFNGYKLDMIKFLRKYDRQNKTRLARVFVAMMNPRYNGAVTLIQNKLRINNKSFKETKALIEQLIFNEFGDISNEMVTFLDSKRGIFEDLELGNKASRQYKNRKKQKMLDKKSAKPCRLNVIYGQRVHPTDSDKWVYYVTVLVDRSKTAQVVAYSPQNWENIFKKEETIIGKSNQMSKLRPKLEKAIKKQLAEAQKIVASAGVGTEEEAAA